MHHGPLLTRRAFGAGLALASLGPRANAAPTRDPLSGEHLYTLVREFDALGEHRTATRGDNATSMWMARHLRAAGFQVELQPFTVPLFDPIRTEVQIANSAPIRDAFPLWPARATLGGGITGPLVSLRDPNPSRGILLAELPYTRGGSIEAPAMRRALDAAVAKGARAIVGVTQGPTGTVIAQNVPLDTPAWPMPIVLVGSRALPSLQAAAERRHPVTVIMTGRITERATATNVVARRPGRGRTIVTSTPKSGWFHVAGERGAGVALWLGLAQWAARRGDADLLWVATSGHELGNHGGHVFQRALAPSPSAVRLWTHIGANVASNDVRNDEMGRVARLPAVRGERGMLAGDAVIAAARRAFAGQPGYETPAPRDTDQAVGEMVVFRDAGYDPLVGLVGGHPLHHTRLDRADVVTSPQALEPVARGLAMIIGSVL